MTSQVSSTAARIMAVHWSSSYDKAASRVALMREYLRRAAWWADALHSSSWPFFDIAQLINPDVRASPAVRGQIEASLTSKGVLPVSLVAKTCERALHFAALLDSGMPLPELAGSVEKPFEPLLVMFERGGDFRVDGSGLIEIDSRGLPKGTIQSMRLDKPVVSLTPAALDALDAADTR